MAKGRRLNSTQSDRLLGLGNYNCDYDYDYNHNHSEFREDQIWSMVEDTQDDNLHDENSYGGAIGEWTPRATAEGTGSRSRRDHVGGLSLAFEEIIQTTSCSTRIMRQFTGNTGKHAAMSAPMNVPDWSKIFRAGELIDNSDDENDDDEDERVGDSRIEPPHEYLARSRRRNNTMSVFEGVGRTLKGRDLSRVRDAVWSQTGFEG